MEPNSTQKTFRPRFGKLWPVGQVWPAASFGKVLLTGSHTRLFMNCLRLRLLSHYNGKAE